LAYFQREFVFYDQQQLQNEIISHYTNQAVKQMYVLVLGLDIMGNPFGLVRDLSSGVEDLFYEPFRVCKLVTDLTNLAVRVLFKGRESLLKVSRSVYAVCLAIRSAVQRVPYRVLLAHWAKVSLRSHSTTNINANDKKR
jgi:hypothetical protein